MPQLEFEVQHYGRGMEKTDVSAHREEIKEIISRVIKEKLMIEHST